MSNCARCGSRFTNQMQLGAHVRACRNAAGTNVVATPLVVTTPVVATPIITAPVGSSVQLPRTTFQELARRNNSNQKSLWRESRVNFLTLPAMPDVSLARDYREVRAHDTHAQTRRDTQCTHNAHTLQRIWLFRTTHTHLFHTYDT